MVIDNNKLQTVPPLKCDMVACDKMDNNLQTKCHNLKLCRMEKVRSGTAIYRKFRLIQLYSLESYKEKLLTGK